MTFDKDKLLDDLQGIYEGHHVNDRIRLVLADLIEEVARLREIVELTTDTCPNCRGEREMGEAKCFVCKGIGVVQPKTCKVCGGNGHLLVPGFYGTPQTCMACKGEGKVSA